MNSSKRELIWALDKEFSSSTSGEVLIGADVLNVADWRLVEVQIDIVETSASSFGDFSWVIETALTDDIWALWVPILNINYELPATVGDSRVIDTAGLGALSVDNELRAWMRWKVVHNVATSQRLRFQIKVFFKARADPPVPAVRDAEMREKARDALVAAGLDPREVVASFALHGLQSETGPRTQARREDQGTARSTAYRTDLTREATERDSSRTQPVRGRLEQPASMRQSSQPPATSFALENAQRVALASARLVLTDAAVESEDEFQSRFLRLVTGISTR